MHGWACTSKPSSCSAAQAQTPPPPSYSYEVVRSRFWRQSPRYSTCAYVPTRRLKAMYQARRHGCGPLRSRSDRPPITSPRRCCNRLGRHSKRRSQTRSGPGVPLQSHRRVAVRSHRRTSHSPTVDPDGNADRWGRYPVQWRLPKCGARGRGCARITCYPDIERLNPDSEGARRSLATDLHTIDHSPTGFGNAG